MRLSSIAKNMLIVISFAAASICYGDELTNLNASTVTGINETISLKNNALEEKSAEQKNESLKKITPSADPAKEESKLKSTDFTDIARLVLENTRDQTAATNAFIERSVYLVLGFFLVVGASAAYFGWEKFRDMKQQVDGLVQRFQTDLEDAKSKAQEVRNAFSASLDSSVDELRAEVNARIELITARAEIAQAELMDDAMQRGQSLASAISRIKAALQIDKLPVPTRIKSLADLGYAKKRQGDIEGALSEIKKAAAIAESDASDMLPLLAYNAACYSALLNRNDTKAWLTKAVNSGAEFRESACRDSDFDSLKEVQWFIDLVSRN